MRVKIATIERSAVLFVLVVMAAAANLVNMGSRLSPIDPVFLKIRSLAVVTCLLSAFVIVRRHLFSVTRQTMIASAPWFCLGFSIILSGVYHKQSGVIVDGIWLGAGVPALFLGALPKGFGRIGYIAAISALTVAALPYIVVSVLTVPITFPYRGILGNPNQMGMLLAGVGWAVAALTHAFVFRRRLVAAVMLVILSIIIVLMIMMTGSRTSLLSYIAGVLALVGITARVKRAYVIAATLVIVIAAFILVAAALAADVPIWDIASGVIAKHQAKQVAGVLSGREVAWMYAIANASLFGQGVGAITNAIGYSAHNSFVSMLSDHGIIAASALILIAGHSVILAWKHWRRYRDVDMYAAVPLVLFIGFWTMAMAEGMFGSIGRGATIATFIAYGIVASSTGDYSARR